MFNKCSNTHGRQYPITNSDDPFWNLSLHFLYSPSIRNNAHCFRFNNSIAHMVFCCWKRFLFNILLNFYTIFCISWPKYLELFVFCIIGSEVSTARSMLQTPYVHEAFEQKRKCHWISAQQFFFSFLWQ